MLPRARVRLIDQGEKSTLPHFAKRSTMIIIADMQKKPISPLCRGQILNSPVAENFLKSHYRPLARGKEYSMETLNIKGMSCQHCVGSVKKALENLPGISQVTVDLAAGQATFLNQGVDRQRLRAAISKIGFEPGD